MSKISSFTKIFSSEFEKCDFFLIDSNENDGMCIRTLCTLIYSMSHEQFFFSHPIELDSQSHKLKYLAEFYLRN